MTALRVGIVGFGYATKTFHAPLVMATEGLELVAISSRRPEEVRAALPDVQCVPSVDALLDLPALDIIVIPTPNDTHFALAKRALERGRHVVVDKPFTLSVDEAKTLTALAQDKGVVLSVFHNRRWDSDFLTLQQMLTQKALGTVVEAELRFDRYRPDVRPRWREQDVPGGGLWYDLGPHLLDQALQLFGMPESLQADIAALRPGAVSDDYANVTLFYPQRRVILHASMLVAVDMPHYAVHGTAGSFVKYGLDVQEDQLKEGKVPGSAGWGVDPQCATLKVRHSDGVLTDKTCASIPGDYRQYYQQLCAAVRGEGQNPVTPEEALRVIHLIEVAVAAAQQHARLPIKDIPLS